MSSSAVVDKTRRQKPSRQISPKDVIRRIGDTNERAVRYVLNPDPKLSRLSKKVREALSRALSREDMIQVAENGLGQPQYTFINPSNSKWYNANVEKYDFDLNKSKQLLQEAGFKLDGGQLKGPNGQPVKLQVLYPVSSNPRAKIATYMQQQYKQLGIEVEVKGLDANAYFEEAKKKNFDISLGSWGGGSIDPDLGPKGQLLSNGQQNVTGFASEKVEVLIVAPPSVASLAPTATCVADGARDIDVTGASFARVAGSDDEPVLNGNHPLLKMENVICTPHLGYVDRDTYEKYYGAAVDNILAFADGKPVNVLNPEVLKKP